ncbi:Hypothetical protein SMAX5B_002339 [Scophthalmus maximus]|uniref:Uncharacterized protein n=1 Tax=Scophthalmus maximus TaxID=52904 RepID=A0A2U9BFY1_SCOMX|nr:Hypothetical protein SMAX5B_002339 [Scophthalmus maximus]
MRLPVRGLRSGVQVLVHQHLFDIYYGGSEVKIQVHRQVNDESNDNMLRTKISNET